MIGTAGDTELNVAQLDDEIVGWMVERLAQVPGYSQVLTEERERALRIRLRAEAAEAKEQLGRPPSRTSHHFRLTQVDKYEGRPVVFDEVLTMARLEELISNQLDIMMRCIDKALEIPRAKHGYSDEDLTAVQMVGGGSRMPCIRRHVRRRFPRVSFRGLEAGIEPGGLVVRGAAIHAAQLDPDNLDMVETVLVDIAGHTLSTGAMDVQTVREVLLPLIPRGAPLPARTTHFFATSAGNYQTRCILRLYQGEGPIPGAAEVAMIGEYLIDIEPCPESIPMEVGLVLDESGMLSVTFTDMRTEKQLPCRITDLESGHSG